MSVCALYQLYGPSASVVKWHLPLMDHNGTKRPGFELGVHFHWASRRWCILILWTLTTAVAGFQELAKYSMARSIIGKIQPAPTLNSSICSLLATFKRCHGSWINFAFDGSWMGQRFLELNTAFSSTWANGLKQRKEATEVAFFSSCERTWHKNWQPFGQRHIPSHAHKAFHARKLRQFSGSG